MSYITGWLPVTAVLVVIAAVVYVVRNYSGTPDYVTVTVDTEKPPVITYSKHSFTRLSFGKIVGYSVITLLLLWLLFWGGWNTLTGSIPASRTIQHTKVVYKTRVERSTFVSMTQAQVCSSIPVRTLDVHATTWTELVPGVPGCVLMADSTLDGKYATQCTGMHGEYPVICDDGLSAQFLKLGENDGKPLKLRYWFVPLTTK